MNAINILIHLILAIVGSSAAIVFHENPNGSFASKTLQEQVTKAIKSLSSEDIWPKDITGYMNRYYGSNWTAINIFSSYMDDIEFGFDGMKGTETDYTASFQLNQTDHFVLTKSQS